MASPAHGQTLVAASTSCENPKISISVKPVPCGGQQQASVCQRLVVATFSSSTPMSWRVFGPATPPTHPPIPPVPDLRDRDHDLLRRVEGARHHSQSDHLAFGRTVAIEKGTEYISESGMKWMSGGTKRQCTRALRPPCS